jgi:hypothetical protein
MKFNARHQSCSGVAGVIFECVGEALLRLRRIRRTGQGKEDTAVKAGEEEAFGK